jgi:predicted transcriptional regulator
MERVTEMDPPRKAEQDEETPVFEDWEEPSSVVSGDRTRDDFLDVALQLREPATVSEIAERADRGEDSAREYMRFFAEIGVVERVTERPELYRTDRDYLRWRQVRRVNQEHEPEEIAEMLSEVTGRVERYRDEFGVELPEEVSVSEYAEEHNEGVEEVWQKLAEWKTDAERRRIFDEALKKAEQQTVV